LKNFRWLSEPVISPHGHGHISSRPLLHLAEPGVERTSSPKIPPAHNEIGFGELVRALPSPSGHLSDAADIRTRCRTIQRRIPAPIITVVLDSLEFGRTPPLVAVGSFDHCYARVL
jgi:hypothetical protein